MPNIGVAIRDEIARVARKSTKAELEMLRKADAQHRRDIAALKKEVAQLARQLKSKRRGAESSAEIDDEGAAPQKNAARVRFSADAFAKKRQQLGLSAADMAKLLGVSSLSVYKWESGTRRPRDKQLEAIASIRKLGKREAASRLAELSAS